MYDASPYVYGSMVTLSATNSSSAPGRVPPSVAIFISSGQSVRSSATAVAAESLTPLEQGAAKVPADWGPGLANRDLGGTRWFDPADPGNGIRIDKAVPDSPFPSQQVDHVIVRSGGRVIGPDGKPIVGSIKQNPDAHIPLSDWLNWTSWNTP